MSSPKPITIDFSIRNAVMQAVPREPLLTSDGIGWSSLRLEYQHQPAHETPELISKQHILSISTGQPFLREWKDNGRFKGRQHQAGDVFLLTANQPIQHRWFSEVEMVHLYLEPAQFAQTFYESVGTDTVELLPQIGIHDPLIQNIGAALKAEAESGDRSSRLYAESAATFLTAHLIRHYSTRQPALRVSSGGLTQHRLNLAIAYMHAHLAEEISLEAIANELGMSRYYFCRLFKQSTGLSPYRYVIKLRIDRARELLLQGNKNIADVALQVGFTNQSLFTRHFKRWTGVTPGQILN